MFSLRKPSGSKSHNLFNTATCIHGFVAFPCAFLKYKHYAIRTTLLSIITCSLAFLVSPAPPGMNKQMRSGARRLEGVVLGGDLVVVEVAEEGNLLEDVGLDTGNTVEEEEGEDAGGDTEGGADGAPVCVCC
jgi:hypothetical protein